MRRRSGAATTQRKTLHEHGAVETRVCDTAAPPPFIFTLKQRQSGGEKRLAVELFRLGLRGDWAGELLTSQPVMNVLRQTQWDIVHAQENDVNARIDGGLPREGAVARFAEKAVDDRYLYV
mgnify:CR=1